MGDKNKSQDGLTWVEALVAMGEGKEVRRAGWVGWGDDVLCFNANKEVVHATTGEAANNPVGWFVSSDWEILP